MSKLDDQFAVRVDRPSQAPTATIDAVKKLDCGEPGMWEKPSYEIISAGAEVTAYIHKR